MLDGRETGLIHNAHLSYN